MRRVRRGAMVGWKGGIAMATVSHEVSGRLPERRRWSQLLVRECWASLAIAVMWLAVLFDALFGPDLVASSATNASMTSIPSAIVVAFFAYLGTRVVARYGLGPGRGGE
jgi:hypothetical protein